MRYIYKKIHYLTFDLDLGAKVTRNVAQYPLHHVTYSATKFEVATSNRLGGDTFTRNVTDAHPHGRTDAQTDGRRTDFGTKLIYPFFLKKKAGIIIQVHVTRYMTFEEANSKINSLYGALPIEMICECRNAESLTSLI